MRHILKHIIMDTYEFSDILAIIADYLPQTSVLSLCKTTSSLNVMINRIMFSRDYSYQKLRECWTFNDFIVDDNSRTKRYLRAVFGDETLVNSIELTKCNPISVTQWLYILRNEKLIAWIIRSGVSLNVPFVGEIYNPSDCIISAIEYTHNYNVGLLYDGSTIAKYVTNEIKYSIICGKVKGLSILPTSTQLSKYEWRKLNNCDYVPSAVATHIIVNSKVDKIYREFACYNDSAVCGYLFRYLEKSGIDINDSKYARYLYKEYIIPQALSPNCPFKLKYVCDGVRFDIMHPGIVRNPRIGTYYFNVAKNKTESVLLQGYVIKTLFDAGCTIMQMRQFARTYLPVIPVKGMRDIIDMLITYHTGKHAFTIEYNSMMRDHICDYFGISATGYTKDFARIFSV